jgi:outer membrane protein assembly factor BamB
MVRGGTFVVATVFTLACDNSDPVAPDLSAERIIWSAALRGWAEGQVAATAELVFAATDSGLVAIDRASGQQRWTASVPGLSGSKRVLVRAGRVLTAGNGSVQANDVVTGALIWERAFDINVSSPDASDLAADDAALFVGLRDGRSLALAQADGHTLWEAVIATPDWTFKGLVGGATLSGDTLYVTATRYLNANAFEEAAVIVALDRQSGRELWRYQSGRTDTSISHAAELTGPNLVFTDAYIGSVIAIDRATGVERWRQPTYGFFFGAPVIRGDTVFVATAASRAYALDAASGKILWTAKLEAGATSVGVCGSELFAGDFHVEVHKAANGGSVGLAFKGSAEEIVTSLITVLDGVVYVGTNKRLIAFRCN